MVCFPDPESKTLYSHLAEILLSGYAGVRPFNHVQVPPVGPRIENVSFVRITHRGSQEFRSLEFKGGSGSGFLHHFTQTPLRQSPCSPRSQQVEGGGRLHLVM